VSEQPATGAGVTRPAGEGVSDEEMAREVAETTSPDRAAEEAFEKAGGKETDKPANEALVDEMPGDDQ
jgi:hypothetical protein